MASVSIISRISVFGREATKKYWQNQKTLSPAEKEAQHAARPALHAAIVAAIAAWLLMEYGPREIPGANELFAQTVYDTLFPKEIGYHALKAFATDKAYLDWYLNRVLRDKDYIEYANIKFVERLKAIYDSICIFSKWMNSPDFNLDDNDKFSEILRNTEKNEYGQIIGPVINTKLPYWEPMAIHFLEELTPSPH